MAATKGNCFICGKTLGKSAIKNHILKEHCGGDEECLLFKAEGAYNKNYWLYFTVPVDATLAALDKFLREIWCECCDHLSAFRRGSAEFGKTRKISSLSAGDTLFYEYDFGSTTDIAISVIEAVWRPKQKQKAQLLARNEPLERACDICGAPATQINAWEGELLCDKCADEADDEDALLPFVNSPRSGVCGYMGELDKWTFAGGK